MILICHEFRLDRLEEKIDRSRLYTEEELHELYRDKQLDQYPREEEE